MSVCKIKEPHGPHYICTCAASVYGTAYCPTHSTVTTSAICFGIPTESP